MDYCSFVLQRYLAGGCDLIALCKVPERYVGSGLVTQVGDDPIIRFHDLLNTQEL